MNVPGPIVLDVSDPKGKSTPPTSLSRDPTALGRPGTSSDVTTEMSVSGILTVFTPLSLWVTHTSSS